MIEVPCGDLSGGAEFISSVTDSQEVLVLRGLAL